MLSEVDATNHKITSATSCIMLLTTRMPSEKLGNETLQA